MEVCYIYVREEHNYMAEHLELEVSRREITGKAAKRLRKAGIIPANIFGHQEASQAVQMDALAFERLRRSNASNGIITLRMPASRGVRTELLGQMQHDPR